MSSAVTSYADEQDQDSDESVEPEQHAFVPVHEESTEAAATNPEVDEQQLATNNCLESDVDILNLDEACKVSCDEDESDNLALSDLMELIHANKPIPGVKELNIQATNLPPTASQQDRKTKPWET